MKINRRQFLKRTGVMAAGAAAAAVVGVPEGRPLPPASDPTSVASWGAASTDLIYISGSEAVFTKGALVLIEDYGYGETEDAWAVEV